MKMGNLIYKKTFRWLFAIVLLTLASMYTVAIETTDLLVTNINDTGEGSLRAALIAANQSPGHDTIRFRIPGAGPHTIVPQSPLPSITDMMTIDGTTQPGAQCDNTAQNLMIEVDGHDAGDKVSGLTIEGGNVLLRGLVINQFDYHGVYVKSSYGNTRVECNFIGTDVSGTIARGNGRAGILVHDSPDNTIGGVLPDKRNVISGNLWDGVVILGTGSYSNTVLGNLIGTDITGTDALGNRNVGVFIDRASHNFIGGTDPKSRNIISGNGWEGVYIYKPSATHNIVAGNYIGTDITGTVALGNSDSGIVISQAANNLIGGTSPGARNLISGNGRQGVYIFAPNAMYNRVIGNYIGTDVSGVNALGNHGSGVFLELTFNNAIGGDEPAKHNLIVANGEYGIYLFGHGWDDNLIKSNSLEVTMDRGTKLRNGIADTQLDFVDTGLET